MQWINPNRLTFNIDKTDFIMQTKGEKHEIQSVWTTFHWQGALLSSLFRVVFFIPEGRKIAQPWRKSISRGQDIHYTIKCVYKIWGLNITFEAINAEKWLWLIFEESLAAYASWQGLSFCITLMCLFFFFLILTIWVSVHIEESMVGWCNLLRMKTAHYPPALH